MKSAGRKSLCRKGVLYGAVSFEVLVERVARNFIALFLVGGFSVERFSGWRSSEGPRSAPSIAFINIIAGFSKLNGQCRPVPDLFHLISSSPSGSSCGSRTVDAKVASSDRTTIVAFMAGLLSLHPIFRFVVIQFTNAFVWGRKIVGGE